MKYQNILRELSAFVVKKWNAKMSEQEKQKYEKPELNGLGRHNGKLSDKELENVAGGYAENCCAGQVAKDDPNCASQCCMGNEALNGCMLGDIDQEYCGRGDRVVANHCGAGQTDDTSSGGGGW